MAAIFELLIRAWEIITGRRTHRRGVSPPNSTDEGARGRRSWIWFIAWTGTGVGYALGFLGAPTIGPFVVIIAVVATIVLGTRPTARVGLPGLVSGLSLPLFYVAYLNRSGPGTICRTIGTTGRSCVDGWSPWPWLVVGVVLLVAGCAWFARTDRADTHRLAAQRP